MVLTLILSACQVPPLDVYHSMNDKVDFSQYKTFSVNSTTISDAAFLDVLTRKISLVLNDKGYRQETETKADLVVVYHIDIDQGNKLKQASIPIKGNIYTHSTLEAVYEAQILVNVVDTKTRMVIWKASSSRELASIDTSELDEDKVHQRMLELFESLPSQ